MVNYSDKLVVNGDGSSPIRERLRQWVRAVALDLHFRGEREVECPLMLTNESSLTLFPFEQVVGRSEKGERGDLAMR